SPDSLRAKSIPHKAFCFGCVPICKSQRAPPWRARNAVAVDPGENLDFDPRRVEAPRPHRDPLLTGYACAPDAIDAGVATDTYILDVELGPPLGSDDLLIRHEAGDSRCDA